MEQTAPATGRVPAKRPSFGRRLGAVYLDLLLSAFLAWVLATAFSIRGEWSTLTFGLYLLQYVVCRGALRPSLGDFFMGIRYLSSSSKQVVADIRVVNPKVPLNGFLLLAGVVEITLAVLSFALWTVMDRSVLLGQTLTLPTAFLWDTCLGFLYFLSAALLLSASRNAVWVVPILHGILVSEAVVSLQAWQRLLAASPILLPGTEQPVALPAGLVETLLIVGLGWTLTLLIGLWFSRKLLAH